jgi:probable rRNA maturation factor
MIILDPDLALSAAADPPLTASAVRNHVAASKQDRIPSARTLSRFLTEAQAATRLRGQVTVLLTTDESIRQLNRRFRGKNKSTDVLSFPADGPAADGIAGDLAISVPTAQNQAREQGHRLITEIKVLILHGLLHLAGYDHEIDNGQMRRREALLRSRLNLPQGLIERTSVAPTKRSVRQASVSKKIKQASSKPRPKTRSKGPRP